jgi:hypothetical protein
VIDEADHICLQPLAVNAMVQATLHFELHFEPNGGFHEASVDFWIRGSRPARCRNLIAFAFNFERPFCRNHGHGVTEKISNRGRREQTSD